MSNRREFLINLLKPKHKGFVPLPPYNLERSLFSEFCIECIEQAQKQNLQPPCVQACDEIYKQENKNGVPQDKG